MVGAKAGDSLVVIGATAFDLAAELAKVTGLNGQTVVVHPDPAARERVDAAAALVGALLEFRQGSPKNVPLDDGSQSVAVLSASLSSWPTSDRKEILAEIFRVLRSGGRIIVIQAGKGSARAGERLSHEDVLALLTGAGARAARLLADVGGVSYFEARK